MEWRAGEANDQGMEQNLALIAQVEELAARAWPGLEVMPLNGWRLRYSQGVTRRANSVWPNARTDGSVAVLDAQVAEVEAYYAARGLPARYQICPAAQPAHLDELLAARGYRADARTAVQTAALAQALDKLAAAPDHPVRLAARPDETWMAIYCIAEEVSAKQAKVRRAIMDRIAAPAAYALVEVNGEPAAVASAVLEAGWVGLFNIGVAPQARRQGAAQAAMRALLAWAAAEGATSAYLQVMVNNGPALALYDRLGFVTQYHYHYREQPR